MSNTALSETLADTSSPCLKGIRHFRPDHWWFHWWFTSVFSTRYVKAISFVLLKEIRQSMQLQFRIKYTCVLLFFCCLYLQLTITPSSLQEMERTSSHGKNLEVKNIFPSICHLLHGPRGETVIWSLLHFNVPQWPCAVEAMRPLTGQLQHWPTIPISLSHKWAAVFLLGGKK